jgi:radical SAM protein with 4Fe4S-binding SPASM domain
LRHAVKEIRSVRSFHDLKSLNDKVSFLLLRARGDFVKGTRVPPSLQIEPTNNCNLHCTCCSGYTNTRKRGFMDLKLFSNIIDEAAEIGVKRIHLYLHGEPLLHPKIGDMIRHVKSRGLALTMATNAMLLDGNRIRDVLESGMTSADYLLFSVLGFSKEAHEKIQRGVNHEQVQKNIADVMQYRKAHRLKGPIAETVLYVLPENRGEEEAYTSYWRKIVDNARIGDASEQYAEFREGVTSVPHRAKTCHHLWERMCVHWNGNVPLCHADIDGEYALGNVKSQSIKEIWNGDRATRIRSFHRQHDFEAVPICAACDW